jgi:N-acetylneuraminic acid mutarotase
MKKIISLTSLVLFLNLLNAQIWTQKTDFPGLAREAGVMCYLNSKVYVGIGGTSAMYNDWYEYDPQNDSWIQKADFPASGRFAPASFVLNGKIYVGCGFETGFAPTQDFYAYDPLLDTWTQIADFAGGVRGGALSFSTTNFGYVGTGAGASFAVMSDFWKYDDNTDSWTQLNDFSGGIRWRMANFTISDTVYAGCGADASSGQATFWKYDEGNDNWIQIADFPGLARVSPFAVVLDNAGYVGTGSSFTTGVSYQDVYKYIPATNTWSAALDFDGGARNSSVYTSGGGVAWVSLGGSASGWKKDLWEFSSLTAENTENTELLINIYPNPSKGFIYTSIQSEPIDFIIHNSAGQIVLRGNSGSPIEINHLTNGIYTITILHSNGAVTKRILLNK